jgi:5-methylcytosine-specific restriction endonuclease McrA
LRAGYRKWPARFEALAKAKCGRKTNKATGRMAEHYKCNKCKKEFPAKDVQVDHIKPVVDPKEGFKDWNVFIDRLFCGVENLQVLCTGCHDLKTAKERKVRNS